MVDHPAPVLADVVPDHSAAGGIPPCQRLLRGREQLACALAYREAFPRTPIDGTRGCCGLVAVASNTIFTPADG